MIDSAAGEGESQQIIYRNGGDVTAEDVQMLCDKVPARTSLLTYTADLLIFEAGPVVFVEAIVFEIQALHADVCAYNQAVALNK